MLTALVLLSALYATSESASRYIIYGYNVPVVGVTNVAFPIDVCVNYLIELGAGFTAVNSFGKFECNTAKDEVTLVSYGDDATCTTTPEPAVVVSNANASAAQIGEFNCDGEDNYAVVESCTVDAVQPEPTIGADGGQAVCCGNDACLAQYTATDVCVQIAGTTTYQMLSCDSMNAVTTAYNTSDCSNAGSVQDANDPNTCAYYSTAVIFSVYRRMTACVANSAALSPDTFCPPPTASPTMEPTETTKAPTNAPTKAPESTSDAAPVVITGAMMMMMLFFVSVVV